MVNDGTDDDDDDDDDYGDDDDGDDDGDGNDGAELQKRADQSVLFFLAGANFWEKHAKNC